MIGVADWLEPPELAIERVIRAHTTTVIASSTSSTGRLSLRRRPPAAAPALPAGPAPHRRFAARPARRPPAGAAAWGR
ncbi:hypothetical protein, partial [Frankia nepalensis]|uniref:hypothetical protein n=1 Tax=Frankia nepalensis TaxID=1836974 RepID=UPI0019338B15